MKQPCSIFLLVLSCGTFLGAQAQVISLRDASGALVNGTVITVNEPLSGDSEQTPGVGLSAENTSGSDLTINVRRYEPVSYTHLRAHETVLDLVCRLLLAKKTQKKQKKN